MEQIKKVRIATIIFLGFVIPALLVAMLNRSEKEKQENVEYRNYIYYHCADWGPNEDGTDDLIYFVKQIIYEKNKARFGNDVYFCSMKPDGSEKKEIVKMFTNTKNFLDMHGNTSFMDICYKTRQAAIAIAFGHSEQTGLWVINLDGTGLKRIDAMKWSEDFKPRINHPSWFPDGEHLIYEESWDHKTDNEYIVKVDKNGKNKQYLTTKDDGDVMNRFPAVSPDGSKIAYTHFLFKPHPKYGRLRDGRDLWLMDADGSNKRLLYENRQHYADYPEWNFDGSKIYVTKVSNFTIVDAKTGEELVSKLLKFDGNYWIPRKVHWHAIYGYLADGGGSIGLIKNDLSYYVDTKETFGGYVETSKKRETSKYEYKWR